MIATQTRTPLKRARPALLLLLLSSFVGLSSMRVMAAPAGEQFDSTNLWNASIGGYQTYRIPGIVATKRGVIIAYTSARRTLTPQPDLFPADPDAL